MVVDIKTRRFYRKNSPELARGGMRRRIEISIYYTMDFPNEELPLWQFDGICPRGW